MEIGVGLATNSLLLDEEIVSRLITAGVRYFEISLPSINENALLKLNSSASFKRIKGAMLAVKKYKAQLTISSIVTRLNMDNWESILDVCIAFSADSLALNRFVPGGSGLRHKEELSISDKEFAGLLQGANSKSQAHHYPINITIPVESCIIDHNQYPYLRFGTCACGRVKWVIDPLGNLRTCEQNDEIIGNLLRNSFKELSQSIEVNEFQRRTLKADCQTCSRFTFCGGGCRILRKSEMDKSFI